MIIIIGISIVIIIIDVNIFHYLSHMWSPVASPGRQVRQLIMSFFLIIVQKNPWLFVIVLQTTVTTPTLSAFPWSFLQCSCKFIRKNISIFIKVSPPKWCQPGRLALPLVTPLIISSSSSSSSWVSTPPPQLYIRYDLDLWPLTSENLSSNFQFTHIDTTCSDITSRRKISRPRCDFYLWLFTSKTSGNVHLHDKYLSQVFLKSLNCTVSIHCPCDSRTTSDKKLE